MSAEHEIWSRKREALYSECRATTTRSLLFCPVRFILKCFKFLPFSVYETRPDDELIKSTEFLQYKIGEWGAPCNVSCPATGYK